jgi:hypothetical protein
MDALNNATISAAIAARIAKGQSVAEACTRVANALISVAILTRVEQGQSIADAVDAVLGHGAYARLANAACDALRAKAVSK